MSKNPIFIVVSFLVFSLTFLGCDQVSAIFEYFQKPKQESESLSSTHAAVAQESVKAEQDAQGIPQLPGQPTMDKKSESSLPPSVLAKVGNWTITIEEFKERLNALKEVVPDLNIDDPETKKLMLEELVRQQLLVWDAERKGVANQKDIKDAVEEFRRTLIVQESAKKITENIKGTEEEAKEFYELNKDRIIDPVEWHVREIVVDSKLKANELSVEILKGGDFAEIAKQNSLSKTAAQGGDLGFLAEMPFEDMAAAVERLNTGDVSSVFQGPEGHYIVKVEEKKGGIPIPFEEIKEEIINDRTAFKQQQAILGYLDKLQKEIKVETNEKLLE